MSKVITFSRHFPAKHPRKGEKTYFVEKIWKGLWDAEKSGYNPLRGYWEKYDHAFPVSKDPLESIHKHAPKWHTIRAGNRWKVGDTFSPRVWGSDINPKSGRSGAYQSKQIQFAPDIEIKKIWDVAYHSHIFFLNEKIMTLADVERMANNDGLTLEDFYAWFDVHPKAKKGITHFQILCWSDKIDYP